jgi:hypothetical protein
MNSPQKQAVFVVYLLIGLLVGIYDWQWGDYAYKGFFYNFGMGLVWPIHLPLVGPILKFIFGAIILLALIAFLLAKWASNLRRVTGNAPPPGGVCLSSHNPGVAAAMRILHAQSLLPSVGLAALCVVMGSLVACGDSKLNEAKRQMVAGCHSGGVSEDVCVCVFDKLKEHYGRDAIVVMNESGPPPPDFMYYMAVSAKTCQWDLGDDHERQPTAAKCHRQEPAMTQRPPGYMKVAPDLSAACLPAPDSHDDSRAKAISAINDDDLVRDKNAALQMLSAAANVWWVSASGGECCTAWRCRQLSLAKAFRRPERAPGKGSSNTTHLRSLLRCNRCTSLRQHRRRALSRDSCCTNHRHS